MLHIYATRIPASNFNTLAGAIALSTMLSSSRYHRS
jgi:hypothetical protein